MNPAIIKAEQELQDLHCEEAVLAERVRLLQEQKEWLAGLSDQLTDLAHMVPKIDSPYLTTTEAADYLRTTVQTVYWWVKVGKLHPVPGCRGKFTRDALDRFAKTRRR